MDCGNNDIALPSLILSGAPVPDRALDLPRKKVISDLPALQGEPKWSLRIPTRLRPRRPSPGSKISFEITAAQNNSPIRIGSATPPSIPAPR
jgi:hypothetical protein